METVNFPIYGSVEENEFSKLTKKIDFSPIIPQKLTSYHKNEQPRACPLQIKGFNG